MYKNYKVKTTENEEERAHILNLVREKEGDYLFVVNKLNVRRDYAWFMGKPIRRDGNPIEENEYQDCFHTEALLKNVNGYWEVIASNSHATDLWWYGLWEEYELPRSFFEGN